MYYHGPGAAAAQPSGVTSVPAQPDDAAILGEVRRTLASSDSTRNAAFDAKVENGVVTLTGKTLRQNEADMAGALTAGVAGVKHVKNDIEVEKPLQAVRESEPPAVKAPKETPTRRPPAEEADAGGNKKRRARDLARTGQSQVDGGDYGAAVDTFQQALALDPSNAAAQQGLRKAQKAKQTEEDIMKRRR